VHFLDKKHGAHWAIWEFRAEGTGYPDDEVYGRIWHYPWPDHHPPPFGLLPDCLASMRDWLAGDEKRVVVVHCKAGKGRSGTASCSYLMAEEGWKLEDAIARFTERRMRPGFGAGVSIPSQLRWLGYVDRWTRHGKKYVERKVEVVEVHVWGLRDGVTASIRCFENDGKVIKVLHTFTPEERTMMSGEVKGLGFADAVLEMMGKESKTSKDESATSRRNNDGTSKSSSSATSTPPQQPQSKTAAAKILSEESLVDSPAASDRKPMPDTASVAQPATTQQPTTTTTNGTPPITTNTSTADLPSTTTSTSHSSTHDLFLDAPSQPATSTADAIFRPATPLHIPTNDLNIDFERRTTGTYTWSLTTSVAHVWFNTFFEGNGPEQDGRADESGVFEISWNKMDGIKGSSRKGTRAFDRIAVVWKVVEVKGEVKEPAVGEPVGGEAADWKQRNEDVVESSDEDDKGIKPHRTRE
jgi:protein-tyrosine phosphatase